MAAVHVCATQRVVMCLPMQVLLESVGQMVGVCLPAALYTVETEGNRSLSSPLTVMIN